MSTTGKYDILLVLVGLFLGIYVFAEGFWLSRTELRDKSTCSMIYNGSCPLAKYKKVILVIVDALKYDFIDTNHKLNDSTYWKGNLKVINDIMKKNSPILVNGILSHLTADPPTVTLTRLKGLTSGSLPTFTDISFNFGGGSTIQEDNLIDQWNKNKIPIVFNGDDTWLELFPPEKFHSMNPFSSFVVKDLDMVDRGVTAALNEQFLDQFKLKDLSQFVLVNHLLGVDHCGHTYGQNHPEMRRKLKEMNSLLERIISKVDESTLVLFLGDHGMTLRGDHGGDSEAETDAGLFLYSKSGFPTGLFDKVLTLSQIDLVPFLSFLTGIPIPFSNLGIIEPNLMDEKVRTKALIANARQILNFALHYKLEQNDANSRLNYLIERLRVSLLPENISTDTKLISKLRNLLKEIRDIYRAKWTQFDPFRIYQGIIIAASSFFNLIQIKSVSIYVAVYQMFSFTIAILSVCTNPSLAVLSAILAGSYCVFSICTILTSFCRQLSIFTSGKTVLVYNEWTGTSSLCLWFIYCGSVLSNSFINNEDSVLLFLIQAIVIFQSIFLLLRILFRSNLRKFLHGRGVAHFTRQKVLIFTLLMCVIPALVCITLGILFNWRTCREEQYWCQTLQIIRPIASISDEFRNYKSWRYFISVLCLFGTVLLHYKWFKYLGNINGFGLSALVMRYGLSSASAFLCFHWTIQCLPENFLKLVHPFHLTLFPRLTLFASLISLIFLLLSPLIIFMPSNDDVYIPSTSYHWSRVVPQIFERIRQRHSNRDEIVKVFGLYSVYSSWHLTTLLLLAVMTILFLGDGFAAPIALLALVIILLLCFMYMNNLHGTNQFDFASSWSTVAIFALLSQYSFFVTGHQPSLPTLQWHSAYIIWHGAHTTNLIPTLSILINTFAGPILITWSLSLILPFLCHGPSNPISSFIPQEIQPTNKLSQNGSHCSVPSDTQDSTQSGEFSLAESDLGAAQYSITLKIIYLKFVALHILQTLLAMYSAGFHRRHLMVWKIFAPRMIFSVSGLLTILITSLVSYLVSIRLHHCVIHWKKVHLDSKSS